MTRQFEHATRLAGQQRASVLTLAAFLLAASLQAAPRDNDVTVLQSDDRGIVIEFRPEYLPARTIRGADRPYTLYDFSGSIPLFRGSSFGSPDIRLRSLPLGFQGVEGNSVQVIAADYQEIANVDLAPVPGVRERDNLLEIGDYLPSPSQYAASGFIPASAAELSPISQVRSMVLGALRLFPLQYNPGARTLRKYTRLVVEVTYGPPKEAPVRNDDDILFRNTLLNYNNARNWKFGRVPTLAKGQIQSVLATGEWYRLKITEEGAYVLTPQYLQSAGINVGAIDPRTVKIYGNDGRELLEDPRILRQTDLRENAIYVEGETDGQFNSNDFVLFYAKGTRGLAYDPTSRFLRHYINHYSEVNYYWLTFGGSPGKRMSEQASLSSPPAAIPDRFRDAVALEEEKRNLLRSGKDWYGQRLGPGESFTFVNLLPDLVPNDIVRYRYSLIARSDLFPAYDVRENGVLIGNNHFLAPVGLGVSDYTYATQGTFTTSVSSSILQNQTSLLSFQFKTPSTSGEGWIDWVEIEFPRSFRAQNNYLRFRSPDTAGVVEYRLEQFTATPFILNVTQADSVRRITGALGTYAFRAAEVAGTLSEYCAVAASAFKVPSAIERVANQNLHGQTPGAEFVIIAAPEFRAAADRLKAFREQPAHGNLRTLVVNLDQIYNEFGSGVPDITAIREFLKYAYSSWTPRPLYVLLFGAASYDYKSILGTKSSFVPTWQSVESRDDVYSYATDDYFAEFGSGSAVFLAMGRINCRTLSEATTSVDKIISYEDNSVRDNWKLRMLFIGDDGWTTELGDAEGYIHSEQAEGIAEGYFGSFQRYTPEEFERRKIYLAEYPTVNTAQGRRKPGAYQAIIDQINQGALVVNFAGHGNPAVWTHERVFDVLSSVGQLTNANRLSLFFLATCNFSQYDDPQQRSGAELLMHKPDGGAIGVVSASRKVYQPNNAYLHREVFRRLHFADSYGRNVMVRPAEALYLFKATMGNDVNDQKFFFLGDPSMKLQYPSGFASVDSINGRATVGAGSGTALQPVELKALARVTVKGTVRDLNNQPDTTSNGQVLLAVNDASRRMTIVNFSPGIDWSYLGSGGTIYRGQNSVVNGRFSASFVIPKDIEYADSSARGRIEGYVSMPGGDGVGYFGNVRVGGVDSTAAPDREGPAMAIYLDSRSFRPGDMVGPNPILYVDLKDHNGVNTSVSGIGHRIEVWLNNSAQSKDVTDSYSSKLDNYQEGSVQYQISGLPAGRNTLRVRAWDTFNNASTAETYFDVTSADGLSIVDVMNFPNPFSEETAFTFRQNQLVPLDVKIKIYTLAGRLLQSLETVVSGDLFVRVPWDGRDRDGDRIANGVYLYKVLVRTTDGRFSSEALGKLSVLR